MLHQLTILQVLCISKYWTLSSNTSAVHNGDYAILITHFELIMTLPVHLRHLKMYSYVYWTVRSLWWLLVGTLLLCHTSPPWLLKLISLVIEVARQSINLIIIYYYYYYQALQYRWFLCNWTVVLAYIKFCWQYSYICMGIQIIWSLIIDVFGKNPYCKLSIPHVLIAAIHLYVVIIAYIDYTMDCL